MPFIILHRFTGGNFAAKVMHGSGPYKNWMMNEFEMMNVLHHPRLTRLVEVYDYKVIIFSSPKCNNFVNMIYCCIIITKCIQFFIKDGMTLISELATGGELLDVITSEKYITEIEIAR